MKGKYQEYACRRSCRVEGRSMGSNVADPGEGRLHRAGKVRRYKTSVASGLASDVPDLLCELPSLAAGIFMPPRGELS